MRGVCHRIEAVQNDVVMQEALKSGDSPVIGDSSILEVFVDRRVKLTRQKTAVLIEAKLKVPEPSRCGVRLAPPLSPPVVLKRSVAHHIQWIIRRMRNLCTGPIFFWAESVQKNRYVSVHTKRAIIW